MNEPFLYRPWEIDELTDRQIYDLLFYPRDEHGRLKPMHSVEKKKLSVEEQRCLFFGMGRDMRIPEDVLMAEWERKRGTDEHSK